MFPQPTNTHQEAQGIARVRVSKPRNNPRRRDMSWEEHVVKALPIDRLTSNHVSSVVGRGLNSSLSMMAARHSVSLPDRGLSMALFTLYIPRQGGPMKGIVPSILGANMFQRCLPWVSTVERHNDP